MRYSDSRQVTTSCSYALSLLTAAPLPPRLLRDQPIRRRKRIYYSTWIRFALLLGNSKGCDVETRGNKSSEGRLARYRIYFLTLITSAILQ